MRLTVRSVYDFGSDNHLVGDDLVRPEAWDALRMSTSGPFALAGDRQTWEEAAHAEPVLAARAEAIDAWLGVAGAGHLTSYGVGGATVELLLHEQTPSRRLTLTDYAPDTVQRLAQLFPEATVQRHDLLHDSPLEADMHLLHRVDTEFTDAQWKQIFGRFAGRRILLVASRVISPLDAALALIQRVRSPGLTRTGWARNRSAFESLWAHTHRGEQLTIHDLPAWELRPVE